MPTVQANFDSYRIWYYSGHPYEALIYCYKAGAFVGRMVFFSESAAVPPNSNAGGTPSIHYKLSRFDDVVTILRYEKPLYLFLNLDNLIGTLATNDLEPAGEEEG